MANSSSPSSSSNPTPTPASPNPTPTPTPTPQSPQSEPTPRTRSTSGSPHSPSPQRPRHQSVSPRPRPPPPVMGTPGQSSFAPYTGPRHPTPAPTGPPPFSNVGFGFPGPYPFLGAPGAVPVPVAGAGLYRIGSGVDNPAVRKRVREGGASSSSGKQPAEVVGGDQFACSVCGKRYNSSRALFGHMRSHPNRGWKGAHPPPAFNAAEEFADLQVAVPTEEAAAGGGEAVDPPAAEEGGEGGGGGDHAGQGGEEEEGGQAKAYRVPDLNHPAPPE